MITLFPLKKELPKNGCHGQKEQRKGPMVIPRGTLCWTNYSHPAWTIPNYWQYRTEAADYDGTYFDFFFSYEDCGGYYEIDILAYPDCRGRSESSGTIHWLNSARGGKKICIASGREPRTISAAQELSKAWAEYVAKYIVTGRTPDQQINSQR